MDILCYNPTIAVVCNFTLSLLYLWINSGLQARGEARSLHVHRSIPLEPLIGPTVIGWWIWLLNKGGPIRAGYVFKNPYLKGKDSLI